MQAASRAFLGQSPPARSAIASSGRQLSAARSFKASGIWGSGSVSLAKLSAAHRAAFLDIAKQRARGDVAGELRFWCQVGQDDQDGGFATALGRGHQDDEGRN